MARSAERPLRIDAVRNADPILRAARNVYAESGPDAPIYVIAARAGVGERTLYRRYLSKADLTGSRSLSIRTRAFRICCPDLWGSSD